MSYFNDEFVRGYGYTEEELMGQPHNIERHPEMPVEAFENLWATPKEDKPWAGAVKNRRKNADFYRVLASETPVFEGSRGERLRRGRRAERLAKSFDTEVAGALSSVASQVTELQATARSMSDISVETLRRSASVSAAWEQTTASVQSVAALTEEMSYSIDEISRQVRECARIAAQAVVQVDATDEVPLQHPVYQSMIIKT